MYLSLSTSETVVPLHTIHTLFQYLSLFTSERDVPLHTIHTLFQILGLLGLKQRPQHMVILCWCCASDVYVLQPKQFHQHIHGCHLYHSCAAALFCISSISQRLKRKIYIYTQCFVFFLPVFWSCLLKIMLQSQENMTASIVSTAIWCSSVCVNNIINNPSM